MIFERVLFLGGEAINEPWAILIAADAFIFQR